MLFLRSRVLVWLFITWIPFVATIDYCSDVKCMKGQHTMCMYYWDSPGGECNSLTGQGIDSKQIEDLLHVHNRYRDYLAAGKETRTIDGSTMPEAANMGVLTWDEEIAKIAQRWAIQCHFGHDYCRDLPNMKVGQNVAIDGSTVSGPPNMTSLAVRWYEKEVGFFEASRVASYQHFMQTGHFTQWIWATSYKIGCGYAGFKSDTMNKNFLVCNYGPAGNVARQPIYQQGSPCSACPRGTTCGGDSRYPNLCKAEGGHSAFGEGQYEKLNSGSVPGRSALLAGLCGALVVCASVQLLL
ncbi:venom allergen 5-like [Amphibalanus amphitrite]|nr:venom allergen 5-like [Amphibalanus amphitrite]